MNDGKPVYFAQVEVQKEHTLDKCATLRAYHGSEVSKAKTGGHMFVLSPKTSEAAAFRKNEADLGEGFSYRGSCLSCEDLEFMAGEGRPFEERCLAIGMTDFSLKVPDSARSMLRETAEYDETSANLFFRTIIEEVRDRSRGAPTSGRWVPGSGGPTGERHRRRFSPGCRPCRRAGRGSMAGS